MKRARSTQPTRAMAAKRRPAPLAPSRDAIAARAYELYLARGGADGRDLADWLQAEREFRGRRPPARRSGGG